MKYKLKIVCGTLLLLFLISCQEPGGGGSPADTLPSIPYKRLLANNTPVEFICYVDVEKYNPLNAKDYIFGATADAAETQFFNYVVLAYSYLTKTANGYITLELSPALKYILNNSTTYIKPLHQKGIKVLIEVRSGNFSEDQDGIGVGLGTLDMATINELTKDLKLMVNQYGIDGFDFNDVGGGKKAYPPFTRDLKQFRSDKPMYPNELFTQDGTEDGPPLSDQEIKEKLWLEGGSYLSLLVHRTDEALKETYTWTYRNGPIDDEVNLTVTRTIFVRNKNHGARLPLEVRKAYMPDAYAGADTTTMGNMRYLINDAPYDKDNPKLPFLWDEEFKVDKGEDADDKYAPFTVDLLNQQDSTTAQSWADAFLAGNQHPYGALYFTNLPPASEAHGDLTTYLTYFSRKFFERQVRLTEGGSADYKKTW
ncbi:MAG: hypothetical protein LBK43_01940 [Treponema sp.]|jgi:hypothetical protein|nr:hypothetical protein [Treponema sp.]